MKISNEIKDIKKKLEMLESGIRVVIHNQSNLEKKLDEVLAKNERVKTKKKTNKVPK